MKIYKYLSPERMDVLSRCRIRYTQPGAFNDPFEVKPYVTTISNVDAAESMVDDVLLDEIKKAYE
jgi:hypothetical protein